MNEETKPVILVVEDNDDNRQLVLKVLGRRGYEVVGVVDGNEALERLNDINPDLILMDVILPDMGGADVIKTLKTYPEFKATPVLFITAMVKPEEERRGALKINIDEDWYETIAKPFERGDLLAKVAELLEK